MNGRMLPMSDEVIKAFARHELSRLLEEPEPVSRQRGEASRERMPGSKLAQRDNRAGL